MPHPMLTIRPRERGEGQIGCVVTLGVLLLVTAVLYKVVPVFYANSSLADTANDLSSKAGILAAATLELQLKAKAKELEIPEALAPGAIKVSLAGDKNSGTCSIHLHYTRKVDLYGAYVYPVDFDKIVMNPYMDVR